MSDEWTCGKGLAAHAPLPGAIAGMLSALAEMLDSHTRALDLTEEAGRAEYAAYSSLVAQQRMIAAALTSVGDEMAGYATLPMAPHDMAVLASPESGAAFQALIDAEKALLQVLTATVEEHEGMLAEEPA
jgi:hypothetical protein